MQKLVFLVASLAVLALGFGLAIVVARGDEDPSADRSSARPAVRAPEAPEESGARAELAASQAPEEAPPAPEPAAAPGRGVVEAVTARTYGDWAAGERRVVRGRVALPAGVPEDPTLAVVGLARELGARSIYGPGGALEGLPRFQRARKKEADAPDGEESLSQRARSHDLLASAPVAADGTFELALPADRETCWIALDGRYLYSRAATAVDPEGTEPVLVEAAAGGWVTGAVVLPPGIEDPAAALADMLVYLEPSPERFGAMALAQREVFSRAVRVVPEGRFEIRGVSAAVGYVLRVESSHAAGARIPDVAVAEREARHVTVELVHGARVTGRVVDESGAPVEGAEVEARTGMLFGFAPYEAGSAETDADGWFELAHVTPGKVQVMASKEGYLDSAPRREELEDRGVKEGVLIELGRGASISGVVRLADGTPAAGAEVEVDFDPEALSGMSAFNAARGADGEATADEAGRFEVTGLGRGPFVVAAEFEHGDQELSDRRAGVKPDTHGLELVVRPAPEIAGRVVTAAGEPLPRYRVRAEAESLPFWMAGREAIEKEFESADGSFRLTGFTPGRWRVRASAEGWAASEWESLELPLKDDAPPVELALEPQAVAAGVVLDPDGSPIAGARVRRELTLFEAIASPHPQGEEAVSGEDGAFELGGLGAGSVSLVAVHDLYVESEALVVDLVTGRRTEDLVLRLRVGGTLTGVVYGDDGEPVPGATIVLQPAGTFVPVMLKTDPDGTFRREEMKPGAWQVTAMSEDFDATSMFEGEEPNIAAFMDGMKTTSATVVEGETTHVELGAPPSDPVRVKGEITHAGEPVPQAVVTFLAEDAKGMGGMKFTMTDPKGAYDVVLDGPGRYLMQVQVVGMDAMTQNSTELLQNVPEVEEHEIDVELPGGRISGRVTGPNGEPVENARITLTCDDGLGYGSLLGGRYVEQTTDADGRYDVPYLGPRTYSIAAGGALAGGMFGAAAEVGREVRSGLRLEEGQWMRDVDFRLELPGEVTGRVVDPTGAPVANAAVFVRDEQGRLLERFSMISSDSSGRFRYSGVAPGRYTVSARTGDLASPESAEVVVTSGGAGNAQITVSVGTILKVSVVDQEDGVIRAEIRVLDEEGRQVNGMLSYQEIVDPAAQLFTTSEERVGPLPPGRYTVEATVDGGTVTKPVTLTGQTERKLKLRLR